MSAYPFGGGLSLKDYYARAKERKLKRMAKAEALWGRPGAQTGGIVVGDVRKAKRAKSHLNAKWPDRKLIMKQLDEVCKWIVIRRDRKIYFGYCLICVVKRELGFTSERPRPITTPYHIQPRGDLATRWDLRNVIGTCSPCNLGELMSRSKSALKIRYRKIHSIIIGESVLIELEEMAKTTIHWSTADLIEKRDALKAQLGAGKL